MASHTLPRPFLRLPFQKHHIRPFSSTTPHLLPEPQHTRPPPTLAPQQPKPVRNLQDLIGSIGRDSQTQTRAATARRSALAETEASYRASDLERHLYRRFRPGDIYAPHDLSSIEQQKWRQRTSSGGNITGRGTPANTHTQNRRDVFDVLGMNPLEEWKNF
ncbi:MAG: hypothetical protein L6R38_005834, partial [Xanthoria sp. 2 TBL-2021]